MRRAVVACVVVAGLSTAGGARAQATATISQATLPDDDVNRAECDDASEIDLLVTGSAAPGTTGLSLLAVLFDDVPAGAGGTLACPDVVPQDKPGVVLFEEVVTVLSTGTFRVERKQTRAELAPSDACESPGARVDDGAICFQLIDDDDTILAERALRFEVDTIVPARPVIDGVGAGNGKATLELEPLDEELGDVYDALVQYRPCRDVDAGVSDGDGGPVADAGPSTTIDAESICDAPGPFTQLELDGADDVVITGLQNGVEYEVRVVVRDDFDNESAPSEAKLVTPNDELGPLDFYDGAGSPYSTEVSCSSSSGAGWLLFALAFVVALAPLARLRRRARGSCLPLVLLPMLLAGAEARAESGDLTVSLFGGPYHPGIDLEQTSTGAIFPIYGCFFDNATLIELGGDLDVHVLDVFGSLQLGVGLAGTQAKGKARPIGTAAGTCGEEGDGSVELTLLRVRPALTYRLDPLLDWVGFPLVPYGRLGVIGTAYAFTENGLFPKSGADPLGVVLGWEAAAGVMVALDFWDYLDPFLRMGTRRARANGVFDHAYLYGEAAWQPIDNFGQPSLNVSPTEPFFATNQPWTVHFGVAVDLL